METTENLATDISDYSSEELAIDTDEFEPSSWDTNVLQARQGMGVVVLLTGALTALVLLLQLVLLFQFNTVANQPLPTLVQLQDGTATTVEPMAANERSPQVVREFVLSALTLLMNWDTVMTPPPTPQQQAGLEEIVPVLDPGVTINLPEGENKQITTQAWQASFALSEDFRTAFLEQLARMTPATVFEGSTQVIFIPIQISEPQPVGEGEWQVNVVANLVRISQDNPQGKAIPFNKEVFVRTTDLPKPPNDPELSAIAKSIYQMRLAGLEIVALRDLDHAETLQ
ncbi:MAG: hypothetical protein AAGF24_10515 [Cyanobacteria bacterium P01_H01_bin.121]